MVLDSSLLLFLMSLGMSWAAVLIPAGLADVFVVSRWVGQGLVV